MRTRCSSIYFCTGQPHGFGIFVPFRGEMIGTAVSRRGIFVELSRRGFGPDGQHAQKYCRCFQLTYTFNA